MRKRVTIPFENRTCMRFGRLNLVGRWPVMAGESFAASGQVHIDTHTFRRPGAVLCSELFSFYCPLRWTYPTVVDALVGGWEDATTWMSTTAVSDAPDGLPFLLTHRNTVPTHWLHDYAAFVEHRVKERHIDTEVTSANVITSEVDKEFGYRAWQLRSWGTNLNWSDAHDNTTIGDGDAALDLAKTVAIAREDQAREWQQIRKEERYRQTYGGELDREVLQIPRNLARAKRFYRAAAIEVDQMQSIFAGKARVSLPLRIPRTYVREHGTIYTLQLTRIVPQYRYGEMFLDDPTRLGNTQYMSGHPVQATEKPIQMTPAKMFQDSSGSTELGYKPFGQWHEEPMPTYYHPRLLDLDEGWTYLDTPSSKEALQRHPDYGDEIQTTQLFGAGPVTAIGLVKSNRPVVMTSVKAPSVGGKEGSL